MNEKIERLVNEAHFSREAAKIWVKSDGRCVYCGEDLVMTSLGYSCSEHDHILPVSKYEKLSKCDDNIVLSCKLCNDIKKDYDPLEDSVDKNDCVKIIKKITDERAETIAKIQRYIREQIGKRHAEWWVARQILRGPEIKQRLAPKKDNCF